VINQLKKKEHTTCKENLRKETGLKNFTRLTFAIYGLILVLIYLVVLVTFYKSLFFDFKMFSFLIGTCLWIVLYIKSQQIIDKNQFREFTVLGLLLIILSTVLLIITKTSFLNFMMTAFPLFYILYFRLLLFLFYKDFVTSYKKPTILFASRGRKWTTENLESGYIASKKEVLFSNLLFFGPFILAGIVTYFII
jgi:hypothetical protein